jgi:predicted  nucleic acid-binding Zn-ribbon protein
VQTRIDREKEILQNLDDEKYNLHKKIDNERTDKSLSFGNFRDDINGQLKRQHKFIEAFQKSAMDEFRRLKETLELELFARFETQDEIIDNLSNSIKTFQDTM